MKVKDGFIMRQVGGQSVVLPIGNELDMNMMITLNETGAFLWEHLQEETTEDALVTALRGEYEVDEDMARASVRKFAEKLSAYGFLA